MEDNWISVKERLPELIDPLMGYNDEDEMEVIIPNYKATVMGYDPIKGIIKAELTNRGWSEISSNSTSSIVNVTHWQPLPEPPKPNS